MRCMMPCPCAIWGRTLPPGCRNDKLLGGRPSLCPKLRSRGESGSVPSLESTKVMSIGPSGSGTMLGVQAPQPHEPEASDVIPTFGSRVGGSRKDTQWLCTLRGARRADYNKIVQVQVVSEPFPSPYCLIRIFLTFYAMTITPATLFNICVLVI